eukprot:4921942-Prymnesium_polylepis.1
MPLSCTGAVASSRRVAHREALHAALRGEVPDLAEIARRHGCPAPSRPWDGTAAAGRVRTLRWQLRVPGARRPLALACACAPEMCHGDTICEAIA